MVSYSMKIGANRIYYVYGNGEYSRKNQNISEGISEINKNWKELQGSLRIGNKEILIEYWIEWTDEFREELKRLDILKK